MDSNYGVRELSFSWILIGRLGTFLVSFVSFWCQIDFEVWYLLVMKMVVYFVNYLVKQ